jgi:hypothetical protein
MPRLSTISDRLTTAGSKRSPVVIKTYTGTDFTAVHSTWTFSTGTISLRSSTLPYHSYGNSTESTTATNQSANKTWPLRAGPDISTSTSYTYNITATISVVSFTATVISATLTNLTTVTEQIVVLSANTLSGITTGTAIAFSQPIGGLDIGVVYYVSDLNVNSTGTFRVSASTGSGALILASTGTAQAATVGISRASQNTGYWINGVNVKNPSADREAPNGYLLFPNLEYIAEYITAKKYNYDLNHDQAGGRTISNGSYAYHGYSFAEAWTTGTAHIGNTGTAVTIGTTETSIVSYLGGSLTHTDGHSKIVGWSLDGYPIYGPFGYEQPLDNNSLVRAMISSYTTYETSLDVPARNIDGALSTVTYPMGMFVQDYYYNGSGDLDAHNGRYCITPEYPSGTYAYFCSIDANTLIPTYPYVIGPVFRSIPVGSGQTTSDVTSGGGSAPKQTI